MVDTIRSAVDAAAQARAQRLAELTAVTPLLEQLPGHEVRGHVAGVRSYLHDEILRDAAVEETTLFPVFDRLGEGGGLRAALTVEHDTVRDAAARLDDLARRPLGAAAVRDLSGLLSGIGLLLDQHLGHESDASLTLIAQLGDAEQRRLLAELAGGVAPDSGVPAAWWLPEDLAPIYRTSIGPADLLDPEAMIGASCDAGVLAVVRSAIAASLDHLEAERWRATLVRHSRYRHLVDLAEGCMREAGLWPWAASG